MRLIIELTVEPCLLECKNSTDQSERDWFYDDLLGDPELILHSNLIGDTLGEVKVIKIERDP